MQPTLNLHNDENMFGPPALEIKRLEKLKRLEDQDRYTLRGINLSKNVRLWIDNCLGKG